jgi:hypothetical protein
MTIGKFQLPAARKVPGWPHPPHRWRNPPKYTAEQAAAAVEGYVKGLPVRRIAAVNGLCLQAFYVVLKRAGVPLRKQSAAGNARKCEHCGDAFVPCPSSAGLCCSEECYAEQAREEKRQAGEIAQCRNCGFELPHGARPWRAYCSPRCHAEAKRKDDEDNARRLRRYLAAQVPMNLVTAAIGKSAQYVMRLIRGFCPRCGSQLKKGGGRKECLECGWSNTGGRNA